MSSRRERFTTGLELAGALLPELVEWIQAMRSAGRSDDDIRRDIRDRTDAVRSNRAAIDASIDAKFGERPPTGSHATPPRGALESEPPDDGPPTRSLRATPVPPAVQSGDDDGRA